MNDFIKDERGRLGERVMENQERVYPLGQNAEDLEDAKRQKVREKKRKLLISLGNH